MGKPKEYNVSNFDELCDLVNDENIEVLAEDLKQWLILYSIAVKEFRSKIPNSEKFKNTEICKGSFIWIDDDKNDFKGITVEVE